MRSLEPELADAVGAEHVLTEPAQRAAYETDWTRRWTGTARAVVRPVDTAQVAAVVRICAGHRVPIVVQGGNTGLVGGGVPRGGSPGGLRGESAGDQVLLSTTRLTRLDPVDAEAGQVTAGAGVAVAALQRHARAAGLRYGVDLAARDSATVGGTVATNAGGLHVVAYGDTRRQVTGIEAVLADGSVVSRLAGPVKDSAGYDLAGLLTGSEGTLAVVTAARLRLVPPPDRLSTVALVGVNSVTDAQRLLARQRAAGGLLAAELMLRPGVDLVCRVSGLPEPLPRAFRAYLLLETTADLDLPSTAEAAVDPRLWAYRERHTDAVATLGLVHKMDVAVPPEALAGFLAELPKTIEYAGSAAAAPPRAVHVWGHLAEGNLHVNVVGPPGEDARVDEAVFRLVAAHGGSISAEHGVGVAKARWLHLSRTAAELAAMRRIKAALDPAGLFNPGVLFER